MTRADKLYKMLRERQEESGLVEDIFELMGSCCPSEFHISERGCKDEESCFSCWMRDMEDTEVCVDKVQVEE